jgi:hypothetical protein
MTKIKKRIQFWKQFEDTIISKGAKRHITRLQRVYNKHRSKNK